ncbi:MAG: hypothetical protein KA998_01875 [Rickettsiaceae bacterium]|nr:hypothetical protein [Rickettsiaceae bacterium]
MVIKWSDEKGKGPLVEKEKRLPENDKRIKRLLRKPPNPNSSKYLWDAAEKDYLNADTIELKNAATEELEKLEKKKNRPVRTKEQKIKDLERINTSWKKRYGRPTTLEMTPIESLQRLASSVTEESIAPPPPPSPRSKENKDNGKGI